MKRGWAWFRKHQFDRAVADFDEAARVDPENRDAAYNRAWVWATCPDARFRDGRKAVELAEKICKESGWKDPDYVATLAAACGEAGDFVAAVKWQMKANESLTDPESRADGEARLALYRARKPYRDDRP
ncbi:MAG: tetratricopeptide repeat protein [Solirubrobacteraceae bacterium]